MIRNYFIKTRQICWEIIDREYLEIKTKYDLLYELVEVSIKDFKEKNEIFIIDAGCGHSSRRNFVTKSKITYIGVDISGEDLKRNKDIDYGYVCDLNKIPLKNNSVDIIISAMVFEHLEKPYAVFNEFNRILKYNGYLIFATPCIYNIVIIINRLIPYKISKIISKMLKTSNEDSDVFPTFYKANSIRKLHKLLSENGFIQKNIIMYQPPPYAFVFSKIFCRLIIRYYRFINKFECLKFLRGVIIARFQKKIV